jgi:predicted outer membrane protein
MKTTTPFSDHPWLLPIGSFLFLTLWILLTAPTSAQTQGSPEDTSANPARGILTSRDQAFLEKAGLDGMAQWKLSQLAAERATRLEVRALAQRIAQDHETILGEMKGLAEQKGTIFPAKLDEERQRLLDITAKIQGPEFDRAYLMALRLDHQRDQEEYKNVLFTTQNSDLRGIITRAAALRQAHIALLKKIS